MKCVMDQGRDLHTDIMEHSPGWHWWFSSEQDRPDQAVLELRVQQSHSEARIALLYLTVARDGLRRPYPEGMPRERLGDQSFMSNII